MKFYVDEAGNTGRIWFNNNIFNYGKDRYITLCVLHIANDESEKKLIKKYLNFKEKWNLNYEIKGTDLCKRENNTILDDFINEFILNNDNFFISLVDKKYSVALEISDLLLGWYVKDFNHFMLRHQWAEIFSDQENTFFSSFFALITLPTLENIKKYIDYLMEYQFYLKDGEFEIYILQLKTYCQIIKEKQGFQTLQDDMPKFIKENNKKYFFVPNSFALYNVITSSIELLKDEKENIRVIHDNIEELKNYLQFKFDQEIKKSLKFEKVLKPISLEFEDSKNFILLQLTDNICSIINKLFKESLKSYKDNKIFNKTNEWCLIRLSKILTAIPIKNLNIFLCMEEKVMMRTLTYDFNVINFKKEKFNFFYKLNYDYELYSLLNLFNDFKNHYNQSS